MKLISFLAISCLYILKNSQAIERGYLNTEDIKLVILKEMDSMQKHSDFFEAYNIFITTCEHKVIPMLITLGYEQEENILFCKLIENAIPEYFMPIFTVNTASNDKLIETIIKDFFKIYTELAFDMEKIKIAKIFHDNISVLYKMKNLFPFEPEYFVQLMKSEFLPADSYDINEKNLDKATEDFINLIIHKFIEKSASLLYSNPKLYIYTFYQMFSEPFEVFAYMLNDLSILEKSFIVKHGERQLYLLDNLDNMALKSLNIFKSEKTNALIDKLAKIEKKKELTGAKQNQIPSTDSLELFVSSDQYTPKEDSPTEVNFRLINICVKSTAFASQSLEKMFCYELTAGERDLNYLIENEKYNFRLQEIFRNISEQHEKKFIQYKPSYFTEESEYNTKIYPKFKISLSASVEAFMKELKLLKIEFVNDHLNSVRKNFFYHWRKVVSYFLTKAVYRPGISPPSLLKNLLNFIEYTQDNWLERREVEYFKLGEFYQRFLSTYHTNLQKFTQFK